MTNNKNKNNNKNNYNCGCYVIQSFTQKHMLTVERLMFIEK